MKRTNESNIGVSNLIYGGFLKWWYPQIIQVHRIFHCKPFILRITHLWKPPYGLVILYETFCLIGMSSSELILLCQFSTSVCPAFIILYHPFQAMTLLYSSPSKKTANLCFQYVSDVSEPVRPRKTSWIF